MINSQGTFSKHSSIVSLDGALGLVGPEFSVSSEVKVSVEISGVGGTNVVLVQGRIQNSSVWTTLSTITGAVSTIVDTSSVDFIRFNNSVVDGIGSIVSSGFITDKSAAGGGGGAGDASAANQVIGNASLASINGKMPALVSGKQPVVMDKTDSSVLVSGQSAIGVAPALNPVSVSGVDGGGLKRHILTDASGKVQVYDSALDAKLPALVAGDVPVAINDGAGNGLTSTATGSQRSLDVQLRNSAGASFGAVATPLRIDPTGTTAQPISGSTGLIQQSVNPAARNTSAVVVTPAPQKVFRTTFASVVASGADTSFFTTLQIGSGMAVSQSAGNLVITAGTTANSETILRSTQSFSGALALRWAAILSQRILNNNFYIELVDVIGDGLAFTINSATSVTVTIPSNPFTAASVGQSLIFQALTGTAGTIPGRYAIASVAGNDVTFTVAGFPATGSGTLSLVGWNYVRANYTAAVATTITLETQRRGYNTNSTAFNATVNTTVAPGHMAEITIEDGQVSLADSLQAVAATLAMTRRAETVQSIPEETTTMFFQIHILNGSTAPASTTTLTMGMAAILNRTVQNVALNSVANMSQNAQLPVAVLNTPAVTVSSGTITSVTTVATVTSANLAIPTLVADVASAALTTTTTTAALTPTFGISYEVNIPVTVVSGTSPTLDVSIEESDDTGTNWYKVYDFPRITATGIYRSPAIPFLGNRVRYVQTVGGTTPSFTRAINRLQSSYPAIPQRQLIDRTIVLTTLNSTTALILARDCGNGIQLMINVGAITTTAPAIQLEGSDDFGTTWYSIGAPLTAVANSTVQLTVNGTNAAALRARVSTAGVGVTAGYVLIKAHD